MKITAVYRAGRFSPNSEENDRLIMDAVVNLLRAGGSDVVCVQEDECEISCDSDLCITMCRSEQACNIIKKSGIASLNSAISPELCSKQNVRSVMRCNNIPMAPDKGSYGYWVKRGDGQPQGSSDVMFAANDKEVELVTKQFAKRGIYNVITEAHVPGDLIKFYAVEGTNFFRMYYPTDDGKFKFNNELHNGRAEHYGFKTEQLKKDVMSLSRLLETPVCGGDCIVSADGSYSIIDFNDWPSFSRCRTEAAEAIVELIDKRYKNDEQL